MIEHRILGVKIIEDPTVPRDTVYFLPPVVGDALQAFLSEPSQERCERVLELVRANARNCAVMKVT